MPLLPIPASSKKLWWLLAALVALGSFALWELSKRPDQIPPRIYGSGYSTGSMTPVDVTIYEYTDRERWITNGRSITFRVPLAYFNFTTALSGGAQSEISIDFDYDTGEPWTREYFARLRDQGAAEAPKSSDAQTTYPWLRRLGAKLSVFRHPFDEREANGLLGAKLGNPDWYYKNHVYLDDAICDYDMYRRRRHGAQHLTPPRYPFDRATVFARVREGKSYDTMVECTALYHHAWCHATREFEGFPLTIYFDGSRLCKVDAVFDRATEVLEGFVIQRTSPVEGWGSTE